MKRPRRPWLATRAALIRAEHAAGRDVSICPACATVLLGEPRRCAMHPDAVPRVWPAPTSHAGEVA